MKSYKLLFLFLTCSLSSIAQLKWQNVDSLYQPLPSSVHIYFSNDSLDGAPNIAYYLEADIKDKNLNFATAVGNGKRYTPTQYYNQENKPLVVVNCTFFEFVHNSNINLVVNNGKILAYNRDTFKTKEHFPGAIGITKKRTADVAWTFTDSSKKRPYAFQVPIGPVEDKAGTFTIKQAKNLNSVVPNARLKKWKVQTAVGGGPVLLQSGQVKITNNEELKFLGKSAKVKHPRTTMGYTKDGKLIILMFQGRAPGIAEGASLEQEAKVLQSLGCWEALNLDGGGSSCLLINGKETIKPSDKQGQRPVPAVFMIRSHK